MTKSLKVTIISQLLLLFTFAYAKPYMYLLLSIVMCYIIVNSISVIKRTINSFSIIILILAVTIFPLAVLNTLQNFSTIAYFFILVFTFLLSIIHTENTRIYNTASRIVLISLQCIVLIASFIKGFSNFPHTIPLENMIEGSSANGITSNIILLQINFSISNYLLNKKATLFTPFVTLLIALFGYGRGSIISATLIIVFCTSIHFYMKKGLAFAAYLAGTVICLFIIISTFSNEIVFFIESKTKLSAGLVDQHRSLIIQDYLSKIDFTTLISGADYSNTSIEKYYNSNPHNSFIRAHHLFGIFFLLMILIMPLYLVLRTKLFIDQLFIGGLLLILYFRAFSEPIIFTTLLDFYIISIFVLIYKHSEIDKDNHHSSTIAY